MSDVSNKLLEATQLIPMPKLSCAYLDEPINQILKYLLIDVLIHTWNDNVDTHGLLFNLQQTLLYAWAVRTMIYTNAYNFPNQYL